MRTLTSYLCLLSVFMTTAAYATPKVKLGVSLALSGQLAEYGVAIKNGVELARQERPELFKNLEIIYEDDQYDAKKAISGFKKLHHIDKVDLMFCWGGDPCSTLAPLAERYKVPLLSQCPLTEISTNRNYVIRFIYNIDKHGEIITEYFKLKKIKKISMISTQFLFFDIMLDGINANLKAEQSFTSLATVLPSETDFKSILLQKNLKNFDIIGVYLLPPQLKLFYKQAKELGVNLNTFGTTTFESTSILKEVMPLIEGVPYTHSTTSEEFLKTYKKEFGNDMHVGYAAGAYDFSLLLGKLVDQKRFSAGDKPELILEAFEAVKPFNGASGKISFVNSEKVGKYFDSGLSVKKFMNGEIHTVFAMEEDC
ncbi:MAG: ABC transporter substrate-binding protein [Bdellovibrionota bacterium]